MNRSDCIDAGTEYCPCYLAEVGECIMCSQLQGKVFCDCTNWKGVCILQEYVWNHARSKPSRGLFRGQILGAEEVAADVLLLTLQVNRTLARELNQPGAYVFLRPPGTAEYFDIPTSVMRADERLETIVLALQQRGVKTKYLFKQRTEKADQEILLRGPYWNGILGLRHLKGLHHAKALLLLRGIGQAPAVPVAKKLRQGGNEVEVLLDPGRIKNFTTALFQEMGCRVLPKIILDLEKLTLRADVLAYLREKILTDGVKLIYCGGPVFLTQGVSNLLQELRSQVALVCSNNTKLCCGEGVCGSCQTRLKNGTRVKSCKTQIDPWEVYR
ncbi:MAG TPA: sulfide/dihydroorotate dehydrogenase-like FAD/NAD-binding protein [Clostridia bacterium]|jgi:dihydroorotate dehydrogenase electron transfer subunit|nr:sulfide/dihydroorotate dehydrogenase-like FAD/NAD-binding protein [Clostridia bacterium]